MRAILILAGCIALTSCVTPPVAHPQQSIGGILASPDHQTFKVSQLRYSMMIKQGVSPLDFTIAPGDVDYPWRMNMTQESDAYDTLQKARN